MLYFTFSKIILTDLYISVPGGLLQGHLVKCLSRIGRDFMYFKQNSHKKSLGNRAYSFKHTNV